MEDDREPELMADPTKPAKHHKQLTELTIENDDIGIETSNRFLFDTVQFAVHSCADESPENTA
jgi:hypothetical protein